MQDPWRQTHRGVSRRLWVIDLREQAGIGGRTTPYWGWEQDAPDRRVWVQRLINGEEWDDCREHLRRAHELVTQPPLAGCPHILQVLDLIEAWDTYLVSEFAETTLDERLRAGPLAGDESEELETALRAALGVIHDAGLVHSDVREDNIFRVEGMWKVGDLGGAVEIGAPIVALQKDREYVPEGVQLGGRAAVANDDYALGVVLGHVRRGRKG